MPSPHLETSEVENELDMGGDVTSPKTGRKSNSYKAATLKIPQEYLTKEQLLDVLNGAFWIAVCLLDSDYDFEYITGLKMLDKLMPVIYPDNEAYIDPKTKLSEEMFKMLIERLEKTVDQLSGWDTKFPGIFALVTRGLVKEFLIDPCYRILIKILPLFYSSPKLALGYQYKTNSPNNTERIFTQLILTFMPLLMLGWHEDKYQNSENITGTPTHSNNSQCSSGSQKEYNNTSSGVNYQLGTWMTSSHYQITNIDPTSNQFSWLLQNSTILPSVQMLICPNFFQQNNPSNVHSTANSTGNISFGYGPLPPHQSAFTTPSNTHITPAYHYTQQQYGGSHSNASKNSFRIKSPVCMIAADLLRDLVTNLSSEEQDKPTSQINPNASSRYYHLSTMLKMYANQTFNRDSIHWSKCVIFHLVDGSSPKVYPYILSTLDAYITHGPISFHVPALHMAYWTLHKCNDFQNANFSDELCHFIHTITERFMNTCIWSEVVSLYQLVINRSSVISSIPQNMLNSMKAFSGLKNKEDSPSSSKESKLNTYINSMNAISSGSNNYGLSSMVSIPTPELEGPRIELSGKVLDHTFNISRICPLLAPNVIFYPNQASNSNKNMHQEPLRPNYSENWVVIFMNSCYGFKNPALSQSRIKHRFQTLLHSLCSNIPTDFKSPSLIFSQSIETLDHQMSVHSSSETASVTEPSHIEEVNQPQQTDQQSNKNPYPDISNYFNENISKINFVDVTLNAWESDKSNLNEVRGHAIASQLDLDEEGLMSDVKEYNPKTSSMPNLTIINDQEENSIQQASHFSPTLNDDNECGTITEKNIPKELKSLLKATNFELTSVGKTELVHCKSATHSLDNYPNFPSKKAWQSNDSMKEANSFNSQVIHGISRVRESSESQKSSSNEKSAIQSRNLSICSDTDSLQIRQFDAIAEIDKILADGSIESGGSDEFDFPPFQRFFTNKSGRERTSLFHMVQMNPGNHYEEYNVDDLELVSIIKNSDEAKKHQNTTIPHECSTPLNDLRKSDHVYEEVDPYQTLSSQPKNFYNDLYQPNSDSQSSDASFIDKTDRVQERTNDSTEKLSIWKQVADEKETTFEQTIMRKFSLLFAENTSTTDPNLADLHSVLISLSTLFNISLQRCCCNSIQKAYITFNNCSPDSDLDASWQMSHFKTQAEMMLATLQVPVLIITQDLYLDPSGQDFPQFMDKVRTLRDSFSEHKTDIDKLNETIKDDDSKKSLLNRRVTITENLKKSLISLLKLYQSICILQKTYYTIISRNNTNDYDVSSDLRKLSEALISTNISKLQEYKTILSQTNTEKNIELTQLWYQDLFMNLSDPHNSDLDQALECLRKAIESQKCDEPEILRTWSYINLVCVDVPTRRRKRIPFQAYSTDSDELRTNLQIITEIIAILVNFCYFKTFNSIDWNEFTPEERINLFKIVDVSPSRPDPKGLYAYLILPSATNISSKTDGKVLLEDVTSELRVCDPSRIYTIFMQNLINSSKI